MFEANLVDPMDPMVTDNHVDEILVNFPNVIPSRPPRETTKPKETPHVNLESSRMNEEVVDDIVRDLDMFSPASKTIQQSP